MGFIERWIDKRRQQELERINRQLEDLKRRGPDFAKQGGESPVVLMKEGGGSKFLLWFLLVCVVLLIGILIYSSFQISSLKEESTQRDATIVLLQKDVINMSTLIDVLQEEIDTKQSSASELGTKYSDAQADLADLEVRLAALNTTLQEKDKEITSLKQQSDERGVLLDELEACIKNDSITDKEDCL